MKNPLDMSKSFFFKVENFAKFRPKKLWYSIKKVGISHLNLFVYMIVVLVFGKISPFFDKEIGKILEFFVFLV